MNEPTTILGKIKKYETIISYVSGTTIVDPMFWDFLLLILCSIDPGNTDHYCYDNVFADMSLNSGDAPSGIYGYIDVFTWEGFVSALVISAMYKSFQGFVASVITALGFVLLFTIRPDIKFCSTGELDKFPFTEVDICDALTFNVLAQP